MKKFKIPSTPSTRAVCIRFPETLIKEVYEVIKGKSCTFSAFVIGATKEALECLKKEK